MTTALEGAVKQLELNLSWTSHFKMRPSLLLKLSLNKRIVIMILGYVDFKCSVSNFRDNSSISHIQSIFLLQKHSLLMHVLRGLLGLLIALDLVEAVYLRLFMLLFFWLLMFISLLNFIKFSLLAVSAQ